MRLLAASYNIQHGIYRPDVLSHGDRSAKLERVCDYLRLKRPDICGINEIYGNGGAFGDQPRRMAEALGCQYVFAKAIENRNGQYGNALLTRFPIIQSRATEIKTAPQIPGRSALYREDRVLLSAEIEAEGRVITVMTCHFGLNADEAEAAANAVKCELQRVKTPVLLMGDFNLTPDSPIVSGLSDLLADTAEGEQLTFPSEDPKSKIDYIFASRDFKVLRSFADGVVISDHLPLFAELEI